MTVRVVNQSRGYAWQGEGGYFPVARIEAEFRRRHQVHPAITVRDVPVSADGTVRVPPDLDLLVFGGAVAGTGPRGWPIGKGNPPFFWNWIHAEQIECRIESAPSWRLLATFAGIAAGCAELTAS